MENTPKEYEWGGMPKQDVCDPTWVCDACTGGCAGGSNWEGRITRGGGCKKTPNQSGGTHGVGRTEDVLPPDAGIRRDRCTHRSHFCDKLFTSIHRGTARLGTKTRTSLHATVPSRARLCVGPIIYMRTPRAPKKRRLRRSLHISSRTKGREAQGKIGCIPHNLILSLYPCPPRTSSSLHG